MALLNFDASKIEITNNYELIPDGDYTAVITDAEWKQTKSGGNMLVLKIEIIEGQNKGRFLFENLNLDNTNQKAVEIAQQTLAKIATALNKTMIEDTSELYNIPMTIKVGKQEGKNGYDDSNKIKSYKSLENSKVATPQKAQPQTAKKPWEK